MAFINWIKSVQGVMVICAALISFVATATTFNLRDYATKDYVAEQIKEANDNLYVGLINDRILELESTDKESVVKYYKRKIRMIEQE